MPVAGDAAIDVLIRCATNAAAGHHCRRPAAPALPPLTTHRSPGVLNVCTPPRNDNCDQPTTNPQTRPRSGGNCPEPGSRGTKDPQVNEHSETFVCTLGVPMPGRGDTSRGETATVRTPSDHSGYKMLPRLQPSHDDCREPSGPHRSISVFTSEGIGLSSHHVQSTTRSAQWSRGLLSARISARRASHCACTSRSTMSRDPAQAHARSPRNTRSRCQSTCHGASR